MTEDRSQIAEDKTIRSYRDLKVYALSYQLAMNLFEISKAFPREEQYSLVDQMRRSSRSVPSNIREGYAKRRYKNIFIKHLHIALGSAEETRTWLEFANDCKYIEKETFSKLDSGYDEVSAMLYTLTNKWQEF